MRRPPRIRHDRTRLSIVTVCSECPPWFAFTFEIDRADEAGVAHLIDCHGIRESDARAAMRERARRRKPTPGRT